MNFSRILVTTLAIVTVLACSVSGATAQSPGPSSAPIVGEGDGWFSGTLTFDGEQLPAAPQSHQENGVWVIVGSGFSGQTMQSDDPRMTGKRTVYRSDFTDSLSDSTAGFTRLLAMVETVDGTWTCDLYEVWVADSGDTQSGWCEGTGALEGLRAYVVFDLGRADPGGKLPVMGFITSRDGLPMPEAPVS
jgi:hypothetical protein